MRQSTLTFGVLLFMFVVYITVRGQLPAYLALFKSKKPAAKSSGSSNSFQGGGGGFGGSGSSGSWGDTLSSFLDSSSSSSGDISGSNFTSDLATI
jgi:hypothetical protein